MSELQAYYATRLYPLQDRALALISQAGTGFYLTGGTALSRAYAHHRYSDDLDLFVNYDTRFSFWSEVILNRLAAQEQWRCEISIRQEYFVRATLWDGDLALKVEFVNDVPSRVGTVQVHPMLGRIDSAENILANKLSALIGRDEPRDIADVWALCTRLGLSLEEAIEGASSKAAGIYPPELARKLCTVTREQWSAVRWIEPPAPDVYISELTALGEQLILP